MKTIYLVRHAESEGNIGLHFQGHHTALTERGYRQARHLARRCAQLHIEIVLASPMVRAQETARTIAEEIGITVQTSDLFAERRRPSAIIGNPMSDEDSQRINEEWTESLFQQHTRVLDGENFDDLYERACNALRHLEETNEDHILVVSHGFFMCMLLACMVHGGDLTPSMFRKIFNSFHTSNAGISVVQHGGQWSPWEILMWNDHAHLAELLPVN